MNTDGAVIDTHVSWLNGRLNVYYYLIPLDGEETPSIEVAIASDCGHLNETFYGEESAYCDEIGCEARLTYGGRKIVSEWLPWHTASDAVGDIEEHLHRLGEAVGWNPYDLLIEVGRIMVELRDTAQRYIEILELDSSCTPNF